MSVIVGHDGTKVKRYRSTVTQPPIVEHFRLRLRLAGSYSEYLHDSDDSAFGDYSLVASLVAFTIDPAKWMLILSPCLCALTRGTSRRYPLEQTRSSGSGIRPGLVRAEAMLHVVPHCDLMLLACSAPKPHVPRPPATTNPPNHRSSLIFTSY